MVSLGDYTGAVVPLPGTKITVYPPQICSDSTLLCAAGLLEGRATVKGMWQAARMDPGEPQVAQQRQVQALHPHPGQL